MVGELARHFLRLFLHVDGRLLVVDQPVDRGGVLVGEQRGQRDPPEILVAAADHEQVVGVVGQLAAQTQVAQHHVDVDVGAHGDHVRVHQAAGGVLRVGQHLLEPLAVFAVHRLEHFVDDGVGQVFDQVGQVVDVQVFDRGDDLVRVHVGQQAFAHFLADVDQHLAVVFLVDQPPHDLALARRQRFEQVADLGRGKRVDQSPHRSEPAAVQRIGQHAQLARGLVVADGFGHAAPRKRNGRKSAGRSAWMQQGWISRRLSPEARAGEMTAARFCRVSVSARRRRCALGRASARCPCGRGPSSARACGPAGRPGRYRGWLAAVPADWPGAG